MRILAVSGSLRRDSYNTQLLRAAVELAPEGVELELCDGLGALPLYDEDLDVEPAPAGRVQDLRERGSRPPTRSCSRRRSTTARSRAR